MAQKIKLGRKYRDEVTGFEGTATSRHEYMNGCVRFNLEAEVTAEGKAPEGLMVDEEQLVKATDGAKPKATSKSGGARPAPAARAS